MLCHHAFSPFDLFLLKIPHTAVLLPERPSRDADSAAGVMYHAVSILRHTQRVIIHG